MSNRIKALREAKGITQSDLASHVGVVRSAMCHYENGNRQIPDSIKIKLADIFGVSVDYLLGRVDSDATYEPPHIERNRIKELRLARGLSQTEAARIFHVSQGTLSLWENGKVNIDAESLRALAGYFHVSVDYILGRDTDHTRAHTGEHIVSNVTPASPRDFSLKVPVLGFVRAGVNGTLVQELVGYESVSPDDIRGHEVYEFFWLNVVGDSMEPSLYEGDMILVHKQDYVDSGSVAVVSVDGEEGVVKKIVYDDQHIELQSFNPDYPVRMFYGAEMERIAVLGLVKQSRRKW